MLNRSPHTISADSGDPACPFPVVGIGASAGGLEAVTSFLASASGSENMAFVLVQHLDPNHDSLMAELLGRRTDLEVLQAQDGDRIAAGTVYVIPPGHGLELDGSTLHLTTFEQPRGLRRPIDTFFASLAAGQGSNAACIIMSGTGADGATGLRAIKEYGGIALAQEPETAAYDGMPIAAIGTGLVDFVCAPDGMIETLRTYFARLDDDEVEAAADTVTEHVDDMCSAIKPIVGHDFSGYKPSTLERRIARRMQVLGITSASEYLDRLRGDGDECETLFRDLLINVTSFFRDKEYFEALRERAIVPIVQSSASSDEIRIWVAGCSSGEEAYTIAMLFAEAMRNADVRPFVQIFATDIDDGMLSIAREGRYPGSALADIPSPLRDRYTMGLERDFQFVPRIRDMIRFSSHSIIKDPPFSRVSLISCRNLLIYMGDKIQRALIPLMHYSLREGGFLFLGPSESLSGREDLFAPINQKARLYRRKDKPAAYPLELPSRSMPRQQMDRQGEEGGRSLPALTDASDQFAQVVLDRYAPVSIRITSDGEMLASYGDLSRYFALKPGLGTLNAFDLARKGLREILSVLVREVADKHQRRARGDVEVISPFGSQSIDLVADPLPDGSIALVCIETDRFKAELRDIYTTPLDPDDRLNEVEEELRHTRTRLRGTVEELETANEELKSSNEEMMSMNEELQSANEELSTVNEELKTKVDELAIANDDLSNFLRSTQLAVVIVDKHLRLRTFTDPAKHIFPFQPSDKCRPLSDVTALIEDERLDEETKRCLDTGEVTERVVQRKDATATFLMRVLPYYDGEGAIDGVTLTFADVTELKQLERKLRLEGDRLSLALQAGGMGVWEYYEDTEAVVPDPAVKELFGFGMHEGDKLSDYLKRMPERDAEGVRAAIDRSIVGNAPFDIEFRVKREGGHRWLHAVGQMGEAGDGRKRLFGLTHDVTFQEEAKAAQELILREMDHRVKNIFAVITSIISIASRDAESVEDFASALQSRVLGLSRAHDLTSGRGRASSVTMTALIRSILSPYMNDGRIDLVGDKIDVPASCVTPIGMMIHELATNASKYGALSRSC